MDNKIQKGQNTTPLLKSWEQKHGALRKSRVLLSPSAHNMTCHPFSPDTSLPSPHTRNQLTPAWGVSKGTCDLFSLSPAAAGAPVKPCLKKNQLYFYAFLPPRIFIVSLETILTSSQPFIVDLETKRLQRTAQLSKLIHPCDVIVYRSSQRCIIFKDMGE